MTHARRHRRRLTTHLPFPRLPACPCGLPVYRSTCRPAVLPAALPPYRLTALPTLPPCAAPRHTRDTTESTAWPVSRRHQSRQLR